MPPAPARLGGKIAKRQRCARKVGADQMHRAQHRQRVLHDVATRRADTRDDLLPDDTRGYLFADGSFALADEFKLGLQIRTTSDDSYLLNYDVTDEDRLWSGVTLERVRAEGRVIHAGRQAGFAEGRLFGPDGRLYAHATTTCIVLSTRAAEG